MLLKHEGVKLFKKRVWQSMHLSAGSEEENIIWECLIQSLRDVSNIKSISTISKVQIIISLIDNLVI